MVMHQKLKEAEITEQDSFLLTMNLLRIAIFNISYIRGLFPEKYFNDKPVVPALDMKIKELMPMDAESRRLIDWIEKGVYDALQRKYLKTLMFCICETVDGPMIEEYAFSFSYSDSDCQNVMMNVNRTGINKKHGGTFNSTADITPNQMRMSACKMIRTIVQLMSTLDEIPDERTIGMKLLYYNDVTPPDYEPPSFRGYKEAQYVWTKNPLRMEFGNVNSKHLLLTLKNLPMTRSTSPTEIREIQQWNKNFLQEQGIRKYVKTEINDTEPCSKISGHQSPKYKRKFMLWEVSEKTPSQELFAKDFQNNAGPVRDQRSHNNCWTYTGTDLFSAWRLLTEEDSKFRIFSARYLTFYANQMLRAIESQEGDSKKKHYCHGNTIARTLKFIKENGVPEEDPKDAQEDFDCINDAPEENPSVLYKIPEEVDIAESDKLEDLYKMLLHQPVGADLHYFHPEFTNIGSDIYEGPKTKESTYSGLHTVIIVAVRRVKRKLVAIVKSSHGKAKGENGYMKVSLTKMIMGIDNDITSPSFLVTNFTCPLIPSTLEKPISEKRKIEKKRKRKGPGHLPSLVVIGLNDEKKPVALPESARDYVAPENLKPFQDPETFVKSLLKELASKDWIKVCESLNNTRRFAVYHSSLLLPVLEKLIVVMVMAMRNPKTALCKTLIMTSCDIFNAYGETLLEEPHLKSMDNLLFQLLMKASGDKKFVCEEADKALNTMVSSVARLPLLRMLQTYVHHRNPRVRAKAAVSTSNCVSKMELSEMEEFGMVLIAQMAADLLSDKLPEAREAARRMFKSVYKKLTWNGEEEGNKQEAWQKFCEKNVTGLNAQAMIKIISSQ